MTLLHQQITFCNFDGTYTQQPKLLAQLPHRWIDFSQLRGTSLYCSPEAFASICEQMNKIPDCGLTFWGSGNYHYAALAQLRSIQHPFTLVLFDHHTDLQEGSIGSLLSCGSWVRHALSEITHLKKVMIIGPEPVRSQGAALPERHLVTIFPERSLPSAQRLAALIPTEAIYISVDKDLLSERDAKTNWSQGTLPIKTLVHLLDQLIECKQVEGLDVCGEWPVRPHQSYNQQTRAWIHRNECSNWAIAQTFIRHQQSPKPGSAYPVTDSSKHVM